MVLWRYSSKYTQPFQRLFRKIQLIHFYMKFSWKEDGSLPESPFVGLNQLPWRKLSELKMLETTHGRLMGKQLWYSYVIGSVALKCKGSLPTTPSSHFSKIYISVDNCSVLLIIRQFLNLIFLFSKKSSPSRFRVLT